MKIYDDYNWYCGIGNVDWISFIEEEVGAALAAAGVFQINI